MFNELAKHQLEQQSTLKPGDIATGATVPVELIKRYVPGGMLIDLGSGTGEKASILEQAGYGVTGFEINDEAIKVAETRHVVSISGDARFFWKNEINMAMFMYLENVSGVLSQGLLANMVTNRDMRHVLRTADMMLVPKAFLFVAEPVLATERLLSPDEASTVVGNKTLGEYQALWKKKYELYRSLGLPYGVFPVASVRDPDKHARDWDLSVEGGKYLLEHRERLARHVNSGALVGYAKRLNLQLQFAAQVLMPSRLGEPLLGKIMVFQKAGRNYKYRPWVRGRTSTYRRETNDDRQRRIHEDELRYALRFRRELRKNSPATQQPPPVYFLMTEDGVGIHKPM